MSWRQGTHLKWIILHIYIFVKEINIFVSSEISFYTKFCQKNVSSGVESDNTLQKVENR
jgi:hypothetical protein